MKQLRSIPPAERRSWLRPSRAGRRLLAALALMSCALVLAVPLPSHAQLQGTPVISPGFEIVGGNPLRGVIFDSSSVAHAGQLYIYSINSYFGPLVTPLPGASGINERVVAYRVADTSQAIFDANAYIRLGEVSPSWGVSSPFKVAYGKGNAVKAGNGSIYMAFNRATVFDPMPPHSFPGGEFERIFLGISDNGEDFSSSWSPILKRAGTPPNGRPPRFADGWWKGYCQQVVECCDTVFPMSGCSGKCDLECSTGPVTPGMPTPPCGTQCRQYWVSFLSPILAATGDPNTLEGFVPFGYQGEQPHRTGQIRVRDLSSNGETEIQVELRAANGQWRVFPAPTGLNEWQEADTSWADIDFLLYEVQPGLSAWVNLKSGKAWGSTTAPEATLGCPDPLRSGTSAVDRRSYNLSTGSFGAFEGHLFASRNAFGSGYPDFHVTSDGVPVVFRTSSERTCIENPDGYASRWSKFLGQEILVAELPVPPPPPGAATAPSPAHGLTGVSRTPTLSWSSGEGATSHKLYFGTSSSPPLVATLSTATYSPGTLGYGQTYFWRVDEVNETATTQGPTWRFTVIEEPTGGCQPGGGTLCLQTGRFAVQLVGVGATAVPYSDRGGFFRFGNANSYEAGVKILDAGNAFWIFHGSMSSAGYTVRVTDTLTGTSRDYAKAAGSFCGGSDTGTFSIAGIGFGGDGERASIPLAVAEEGADGSCSPSSTRICLLGGRFQVQVRRGGLLQSGLSRTDQSGVFWFASQTNPEVMVKMVNATAVNQEYWVFFGSLTNQAFEVVVTDTVTGQSKSYTSSAAFCGGSDTAAFPG